MKQKLALAVEWAWLEGRIKTPMDVEVFAAEFAEKNLFSKYPKSQQGNFFLGAREIQKDALKVLRILRYGGRKRSDVPAQRIEVIKARLAA